MGPAPLLKTSALQRFIRSDCPMRLRLLTRSRSPSTPCAGRMDQAATGLKPAKALRPRIGFDFPNPTHIGMRAHVAPEHVVLKHLNQNGCSPDNVIRIHRCRGHGSRNRGCKRLLAASAEMKTGLSPRFSGSQTPLELCR